MVLQGAQDVYNYRKTVLIIEDNEINREILKTILLEHYSVIEASNGKEGLEVLSKYKDYVALILLDIQMPVMNGFEFLKEIKKDENYTKIPIIVTTSAADEEEHALQEGASDFVHKPYRPNVILRRVEALIRLRDSLSALTETRLDKLTGLSNRSFFQYISDKILAKADINLTYILLMIQDFSYLNTTYGEKDCDELLRVLGSILKNYDDVCLAMGRYGGDNLAFCINSDIEFRPIIKEIEAKLKARSPIANVSLKHVIYENVDKKLSTNNIINKLFTTYHSPDARREDNIIFFDKSIVDKETYKHLLIRNFEQSLKNNDFKIYIQPKHDATTNELVGGEALVRWIHPKLGFISPDQFIPVFEENGLITKLDEYIVRKTCEFLSKSRKMRLKQIPISINLSRRDLAVFAKPELLVEATEFFGFKKDLLHFEITESLAGNSNEILSKVKIIHDSGFKIEIDDFGSGYSCLGMISDVPMDYLKLDINFAKRIDAQKDLVKYIIAFAHSKNIKVIAEGVEDERTKNIYRDLDCDYIQGYYYSKPLSEEEFIEYLKK